jgi:hypothetical protein
VNAQKPAFFSSSSSLCTRLKHVAKLINLYRSHYRDYLIQGFFCGEFSPPGDKKKGLANPTKGFLRIFVQNSPYLEKKKLEVARFRQCVPLGRQN